MKLSDLSWSQQWREFKKFALKGNLIDLAVAVVLGGAFGKVVTSMVSNVLMPLLGYITPSQEGYRAWKIGKVEIGVFLGELVNFLVIALAMYLIVGKAIGTIQRYSPLAPDDEPTTRECPLCLSTIPIKARKCAHCTADLPTDT